MQTKLNKIRNSNLEIRISNIKSENRRAQRIFVSVFYTFYTLLLSLSRARGDTFIEPFRASDYVFRIFKAFRHSARKYARSIFLGATLFAAAVPALADDVGISKARLIQKTEKSYVLEVDVTQVLVWAIKAPIFPDRFQVSELEYVTQSGWIVVQATATTTGEPLSDQDEILLPWMRNGVIVALIAGVNFVPCSLPNSPANAA